MDSKAKRSTTDLEDLRHEYHLVHEQYIALLSVATVILLGGAIVYHQLLHLTWINAFYFCTVTLATVGYGDITPTTDASKMFTIFYLLIGIGIFATLASLLVRQASLRRELRQARRHQK